ncbi:hypothetical protein BV22DRAFT_1136021 [Leucogyrophana mollusca]|uniref:Uncharacterized protein n=1 Tax=Leucogyrophana mollusca TaxID=85980 RepID=A0ACB8ATY2_9AGAM|nr:hypothetical protein BV22DRAFT_1136021 [Leucogyrophana mollusca]
MIHGVDDLVQAIATYQGTSRSSIIAVGTSLKGQATYVKIWHAQMPTGIGVGQPKVRIWGNIRDCDKVLLAHRRLLSFVAVLCVCIALAASLPISVLALYIETVLRTGIQFVLFVVSGLKWLLGLIEQLLMDLDFESHGPSITALFG